jgi:prolipoprotein diacylglyceryltransferase
LVYSGYAFLLFREEYSVQRLIASCIQEEDKLFYFVTSPTQKDKQVWSMHTITDTRIELVIAI